MARPSLLPCDADALIQVFLSSTAPLQTLLGYGIQPVVVPEVEVELRSNKRWATRIAGDLRKAWGNGLIRPLDATALTSTGMAPPAAAASLQAIQALGATYHTCVDFGEAYTHAAGITLGTPTLSHDITALRALVANGLSVPDPVLRLFDLVALSYQVGQLTVSDCDAIRQVLNAEKEWVPQAFKHSSFASGLNGFCCRIVDGTKPRVGAAPPTIAVPFGTPLLL